MKYPPAYLTPGEWTPNNGDLAEGVHAGQVDAFGCWLAVQRHPIPANIGAAMSNYASYTEVLHVPQFCEHIGFSMFCSGAGEVEIRSQDDSFLSTVYVETPGGADREAGEWYHVTTPVSSVTSDTLQRALELDDQTAPHTARITYDVPATVYVWEVVPFFLTRSVGSQLPSSAVTYHADSVPVAYWNFEDGEGSTVSDTSTAGNLLDGEKASATAGQPLWDTSAKAYGGTSLAFDQADDDAVIVPDNDALDFNTDDAFSISCWIKRSLSYSGSVVGVVTKSAASSPVDSPFEGYALWFSDNEQRRPAFLLYRLVSGIEQLRVHTTTLAFSASDVDWHHVCVTYDGSSNLSGVKIYIDGSSVAVSLAATDTLSPGDDIITSTDLCIGGFIDNAAVNSRAYPFAGNLDEVAIWSKELSSSEVSSVYNGGLAVNLYKGIPQ